jgi:16S rRNA (guanine966-N2)-methyltransferase
MFSAVEHLADLRGAHVLDLYAGSGALGLEAASRGASRVVFVDSSKKVERILKTNVARVQQSLGAGHTFHVVTSPAVSYCQKTTSGDLFDLVLMDPPYDVTAEEITDCLKALVGRLTANNLIVVERAKKSLEPDWPSLFEVIKHKTYGDTAVFFLTYRR